MSPASKISGQSGSPGLACAIAFVRREGAHAGRTRRRILSRAGVHSELDKYRAASALADRQLAALEKRTDRMGGAGISGILTAYRLLNKDPALQKKVEHWIRRRRPAEQAVEQVFSDISAEFARAGSAELAIRQDDISYVCRLLLDCLHRSGKPIAPVRQDAAPAGPFILVAEEVTPLMTARFLNKNLKGILTSLGGPTSHAAIIAREIGVPYVYGVSKTWIHALESGDTLLMDGCRGEVLLNPGSARRRRFEALMKKADTRMRRSQLSAVAPSRTRDGIPIALRANIDFEAELPLVSKFGAEGVGLFRTEYLWSEGREPSEAEQTRVYAAAADQTAPRPLMIRAFDLSGDKFGLALNLERHLDEDHSARIGPAMEQTFLTQARAVLRAARAGNVRIFYPMITSVEEIIAARRLLRVAQQQLKRRSEVYGLPQFGVMVETPAAVVCINEFLPYCDFISIGTNDLIHYSLAVSRTREAGQNLYRPFHPAILRMLDNVAAAAVRQGCPVSVCGEIAQNPLALPFFIGIGVRELSMAAPSIPPVKSLVRNLSVGDCERLADRMLEAPNAASVERIIRRQILPRVKKVLPGHIDHLALKTLF